MGCLLIACSSQNWHWHVLITYSLGCKSKHSITEPVLEMLKDLAQKPVVSCSLHRNLYQRRVFGVSNLSMKQCDRDTYYQSSAIPSYWAAYHFLASFKQKKYAKPWTLTPIYIWTLSGPMLISMTAIFFWLAAHFLADASVVLGGYSMLCMWATSTWHFFCITNLQSSIGVRTPKFVYHMFPNRKKSIFECHPPLWVN